MNRTTIELIALGASAAVNCRPCMQYHFETAKKLGVPEEELQAALEVGIRVNQGAGKKTVEYVKTQFGRPQQGAAVEHGKACCG